MLGTSSAGPATGTLLMSRPDRARRCDDAAATDEHAQDDRVTGAAPGTPRPARRARRQGRSRRTRPSCRARSAARSATTGTRRSSIGEQRCARRDATRPPAPKSVADTNGTKASKTTRPRTRTATTPSAEDHRSSRAPALDRCSGYRADHDAECRGADEGTERDAVVSECAVKEVQVERGDAETEAAERRGREVEEGVAPSERHRCAGQLGRVASVTSTVCVAVSRTIVRRTLFPGRNLRSNDCSACSWSIC